jgi:beta-glucosidase
MAVNVGLRVAVAGLVLWGCISDAIAQTPAYLDTSLPADQRAADLVHRMTLEEKTSQLVNQARAIPRLNVPAYDYQNESLHGVMVDGTTEFPEPIGLAATFDAPAIHQMAAAIGTEGRIKHARAVQAGDSGLFQGLDFWAPNINIFRDPRWGRGQETYGEDPFLTARLAVAFVTGMQGDDPKYYRAISTPKHFAVHSGPEPERHQIDVTVSKHDELDTYLPAFRAAVTEAGAASVMCAYNSINGEPACANEFLLQDQLRGKWGFKGYVVSDCDAVTDVYDHHNYTATPAEGAAISVKRGMDNECVDGIVKIRDDQDYRPYLQAVEQGYLKESDVDIAVTRLFTARMKLGMFDPPAMVRYSKIDEKELDGVKHRLLARRIADESMVLLKNDGTLPLKTAGIKIAVVGSLAEQDRFLLGNYHGVPTRTVSILEGMKKEFAGATIHYVEGTQFLSKRASKVPPDALSIDGRQGVKTSYFQMGGVDLQDSTTRLSLTATHVEPTIDASAQPLPDEVAGKGPMGVHWEADLSAPETGDYSLGLECNDVFRILLDGKPVTWEWDVDGRQVKLGRVHLVKGVRARVVIDYGPQKEEPPVAALVWAKYDPAPQQAAIDAAKDADVVVAVLGITSELEGEEMPVSEQGFIGGDRTSLDLPKPEEDLLEALSATGRPLVLVLMNGSALSVNWADRHANAILEAWYPGEEGGAAVAETLSGRNNPAGRLPVTFYAGVDQLPPFENYFMRGRTYRYFDGKPLYPFGYGLSYARFSYSGLSLPSQGVEAGSPVVAEATVTNTGKVAGDEVAQLYIVSFPDVKGAPLRALRGFQRVHLEPGASRKLRFELKRRDLSMVTEAGEPIVAAGEYRIAVGGGQPGTGIPSVEGSFKVQGTIVLPE